MKLEDWLEFFRRYKKCQVLHFNHFRVLTEMSPHSLRVALKRLAERKIIQRICRGFYANPFNPPALEEISAVLCKPSYISLESALCQHGILSQIPYILTCITTQLPRKFETSFGRIQYRQLKKGYFFGFYQEGAYFLAEPEKAVVDFLYLNKKEDLEGILVEWDVEKLNYPKLRSYASELHLALPVKPVSKS